MEFSAIKARATRIFKSRRVQRALRILKRVLALAILGFIVYQVIEIGWREILRSLPVTPVFYLLFVVIYLLLPTAEVIIYRMIWPIKRLEGFKTFLLKRVYNEEVMGYSGEFYLYLWARRRLDIADADILRNIRDNNILSAINSNVVAFLLVGLLILAGQIEILHLLGDVSAIYVGIGGLLLAAAVALIIQFRRYVFALSLRKAGIVFSVYFGRLILYNTLLVLQWNSVIPQVPLGIWFTFLATMIVMSRIPFMPSKDLMFIGASIEISRYLDVATASIAGMLLVASALSKSSNLIIYLLATYVFKDPDLDRARTARMEAVADEDEGPPSDRNGGEKASEVPKFVDAP